MTADTSTRRGFGLAWHRSLYGRIAIGYVLLIVVFMVAQGALLLWVVQSGAVETAPGRTRQLTADLVQRLNADPSLDLAEYVRTAQPEQHVFVIMKDGRVFGARRPTEVTVRGVIDELQRGRDTGLPATWESSVYRPVPILVGGHTVGILGIVPPTTLEQFGPEIVTIDLGLLATGTLISALVIFAPVRRRILDLESAALRLGAGDLSARAHEEGSDEVAALARAFNDMASELSTRESALEAADRTRRQLLADVSHELMTPLTAVLGNLETLMMAEVRLDDEKRLRQVTVARREAQRIERLVADLLDVARFEAGGGTLNPQDVPAESLFDQVLLSREQESRARNVQLTSSITPPDLVIWGDPFRLEQALQNVTANALRHTPDGGRVELRAEAVDDSIVLTVTDSGEGIAPEDLPLIFARFYKASAARGITSSGQGSGLGLSIVKAIVERHGGRVSASSVVGSGTTIRMELPRVPDRSVATPPATAHAAAAVR